MRPLKKMQGITLMELMIVVVIVGILAAIAFPNYREFAARAKRTEARAALLQIATNQEKFYLQNSRFTDDLGALGLSSNITDSGSYLITVAPSPTLTSNFTATATYQLGGKEGSQCETFSIDGRGAKTSGPDTDCWTRTR